MNLVLIHRNREQARSHIFDQMVSVTTPPAFNHQL